MIKICIHCNEQFEETKKLNRNVCRKCRNRIQKEWVDKKKAETGWIKQKNGRRPYPLKSTEARKRWRDRQKELKVLNERLEWRLYFNKVLDELEQEKSILSWIFDRVCKVTDKQFIVQSELKPKTKTIGRPLDSEIKKRKTNEEIWGEIERGEDNISIWK